MIDVELIQIELSRYKYIVCVYSLTLRFPKEWENVKYLGVKSFENLRFSDDPEALGLPRL